MSHDGGRRCICVSEHRPKVVELDVHHVLPIFLGGADGAGNEVWVCPNTHRATHELLRLYMKGAMAPPEDVVNDYPRYARALAAEGFKRWVESQ